MDRATTRRRTAQIDLRNVSIALTAMLFALALLLAVAGPAAAQITKILRESGLNQADINIATETSEALYQKPGVRVGQKSEWSNPDTGASGVVEILEVQGACVTFVHYTQAPNRQPRRLPSKRCKDASGNWVLTAPE